MFYFEHGSIILPGLQAFIGVTRSYSSHPFLCTLAVVNIQSLVPISSCKCLNTQTIIWLHVTRSYSSHPFLCTLAVVNIQSLIPISSCKCLNTQTIIWSSLMAYKPFGTVSLYMTLAAKNQPCTKHHLAYGNYSTVVVPSDIP